MVKIDYEINSKDKLAATVGGNRANLITPFGGPGGIFNANTVSGFPSATKANDSFLNLAYTRAFSPTKLNELRATAQRRNYQQSQPVSNLAPLSPQFGIVSDISTGPPVLIFDNGLTLGQDPYGPTFEIGNTFVYSDTFSWVRGHNNWKFGAGFSNYQQNTLYDYFGDGSFGYYGYASGGVGTGNSLADFLVGAPNYVFEGSNAASNIRSKATYAFAQDEWRVRPNLTLSLGFAMSTVRLRLTLREEPIPSSPEISRQDFLLRRSVWFFPETLGRLVGPIFRTKPTLDRASVLPGVRAVAARPAFAAASVSSMTS